MAAAGNDRWRIGIVLTTLGLCAFFTAQGATALLSAKVLQTDPEVAVRRPTRTALAAGARRRHDPAIILRRNIFDSALGDLSLEPMDATALQDAEMPEGEVEHQCKNDMRLIGTVVLPGELEQSLAAIVGTDKKAGLHRGGAEIEGARIRAIQSDYVVLQTKTGFCRLAMFEVEGAPAPRLAKARAVAETAKEVTRKTRRPDADRNAGLSDEEIDQGIEKVNDTNYNISRSMLNKVLDNAGRLIGIAAVAPKVEGGRPIGMEIRGIRADTLLTKLGIQNGDILESVNGQSLTSTDAALGAYTTLRTADKFDLSIRRGSESMVINYNLQ
jgi:type II secretory pathway component PulC